MINFKIKKFNKFLKIICIQFFITILILEIIGIWQKSNIYFWDYRYLFLSNNSSRDIEKGLWHYEPNKEIRSIASYAFSKSISWIEYDCRFMTNSLGLVDTNYSKQKIVDWLVIGDSFTEGQGGCPWLTKKNLVDNNINKIVINGGLQGAGIEQMEKVETYISKSTKAKNLVVIAISNDFKRPLPKDFWWSNRECLDNFKCTQYDYWWPVKSESSEEEILNTVKQRRKLRGNLKKDEIKALLYHYSFSYRVYKTLESAIKSKISAEANIKELEENKKNLPIFQDNFNALIRLRKKYPNLKIIMVPQRDEVTILGSKNHDSKYVEIFLKENNFEYSWCKLSGNDFMKIDGHPNNKGYKKLMTCLIDIIK